MHEQRAAAAVASVLVIDDASLVRLYYRQLLEEAGYTVDEALNGVEAFEKIAVQDFDLLIVDINMPKMDGLAFLTALRAQPAPAGTTPALMTSTEDRDRDFEAARNAGANFYLVKPVADELLLRHVAAMTGVRQ